MHYSAMYIPQEIKDAVVNMASVNDIKTALTCALVCKAFVPAARKAAFRNVFINQALCSKRNYLHRITKRVWHAPECVLFFFTHVAGKELAWIPRKIHYHGDPDMDATALHSLIHMLPHIHTFIIQGTDILTDVSSFALLPPLL